MELYELHKQPDTLFNRLKWLSISKTLEFKEDCQIYLRLKSKYIFWRVPKHFQVKLLEPTFKVVITVNNYRYILRSLPNKGDRTQERAYIDIIDRIKRACPSFKDVKYIYINDDDKVHIYRKQKKQPEPIEPVTVEPPPPNIELLQSELPQDFMPNFAPSAELPKKTKAPKDKPPQPFDYSKFINRYPDFKVQYKSNIYLKSGDTPMCAIPTAYLTQPFKTSTAYYIFFTLCHILHNTAIATTYTSYNVSRTVRITPTKLNRITHNTITTKIFINYLNQDLREFATAEKTKKYIKITFNSFFLDSLNPAKASTNYINIPLQLCFNVISKNNLTIYGQSLFLYILQITAKSKDTSFNLSANCKTLLNKANITTKESINTALTRLNKYLTILYNLKIIRAFEPVTLTNYKSSKSLNIKVRNLHVNPITKEPIEPIEPNAPDTVEPVTDDLLTNDEIEALI